MKTPLLAAVISALLLLCTLPSDPTKDPDNATVTFTTIDGEQPVSPVGVTVGDTVTMALRLHLPNFINNIAVSIEVPGKSVDTQAVFAGPWLDTIAEIKMVFPKEGIRWCVITANNSNGSHNPDTLIFNVAVRKVNSSPAWSADTIGKISVRGTADSINLQLYAGDPDSDSVVFRLDSASAATGFHLNLTWLVADSLPGTGTRTLRIVVSDGKSADTVLVVWSVEPSGVVLTVNNDTVTTYMNEPVIIDALKNDSASEGAVITEAVDGSKGSASIRNNKIVYTPASGATGMDSLHYTVNNVTSGTVYITIVMPLIITRIDCCTIPKNGMAAVAVLANDTISHGTLRLDSVAGGKMGDAAVRGDTVDYRADGGITGFDTLKYYVNNGRDSGLVLIAILPIQIFSRPDSAALDEDGAAITIDVLKNDSITSGAMTLTSVSAGRLGKAKIEYDKVSYTPGRDSNGIDTLQYFVNDMSEGTIRITIRPVNDPPVARDTAVTTPEDNAKAIVLSCSDPDGTTPKFVINTPPEHGEVTGDSSATVSYSPDADFNGSDSFSYKTWDGELYSVSAKVKITVQPRNDAPRVTINSGLVATEGGTATITARRFSCTDPDNVANDLTVTITAVPVNGKLEKSGAQVMLNETFPVSEFVSGTFVYTHNGSETAADSIGVSVSDGSLAAGTTIDVTVTPINDPPAFSKTAAQMKNSAGLGNYYFDTVVITDSENNLGGVSISVVPAGMKHTLLPSNGRLVLEWCVDNRTYEVGQTVPVSVTVQDDAVTVKLEWTVTVGKHVWTKVAGGVKSYGVFAAVDSFVIFNAWLNVNVEFEIFRNDLATQIGWTYFGAVQRTSPGSLDMLSVKNNRLYCNSDYIKSFQLATGTAMDSVVLRGGTTPCWVTEHGDVYSCGWYDSSLIYSLNGVEVKMQNVYTGEFEIFCNDILVTDGVTYLVKSKGNVDRLNPAITYIERWNEDCWNGNSLFCTQATLDVSIEWGNHMVADLNNADTIYLYAERGNAVRIINARSNMTEELLPTLSGKGTGSIAMLDGKTGFFIDTTGTVYFSHDGFETIHEEVLPENALSAQYVFISADKKAVFILSKQDAASQRTYYRY